jgi:hypothetical protein
LSHTSKQSIRRRPPLKRQNIGAASSSTAVLDELASRFLQLEQRLKSAEDNNASLENRLQLQEEDNQRLHGIIGGMRYGSSWNGKTADIDIIDDLTRLSPLAMHYNANVTNQFIKDIPEMLWWQKILRPFLNLEDLSILRSSNTFFEKYWQSVMNQNAIRVPQGCPTVEKAMELAVIFSDRKDYARNPLQIVLEKGVQYMISWVVPTD